MFIRTTLIPWQGKNYRFSMAFDLSRYIFRDREEIDVVFREVMANDVIAIGMSEADPHTGLQKMLEKIGHSLQAERVLILRNSRIRPSALPMNGIRRICSRWLLRSSTFP